MDLSGEGMALLFSATWLHRNVMQRQDSSKPAGWADVTTVGELAQWTGGHDTGRSNSPTVIAGSPSAGLPSEEGPPPRLQRSAYWRPRARVSGRSGGPRPCSVHDP
jgi:hypothetical protein